MLVLKLAAAVIVNVSILAVPLVAVAGTFQWWRAWVIVGLMLVGAVLSVLSLPRDLLEERLRPPIQKSQPRLDRVLVILLLAAFIGLLIVTPLDVFHLHLFVKPGPFVSSAGLALYVVGFWIAYLALHENAFASPVVKYQEERNQTVVASGVYSVVRHPMYAGGLLLTIGLPLWLESYVGALFAIVAIASRQKRVRGAIPGAQPSGVRRLREARQIPTNSFSLVNATAGNVGVSRVERDDAAAAITESRRRGQAYLLERRMLRRCVQAT